MCIRDSLFFAAVVIIPELNARAIEEGNKQAIHSGGPAEAALRQVHFFYDERVQ